MIQHRQFIEDRKITVVVIVLLGTREADEHIRDAMRRASYTNVDLRVCEIIQSRQYAFREDNGVWDDPDQADRAKALVQEIGRGIYKDEPLGLGGLGLLVAFYDTCPNNSLPLLH